MDSLNFDATMLSQLSNHALVCLLAENEICTPR